MLKINTPPNLSVRFAETPEEIRAAQRLRYRVFVEELGAQVSAQAHLAKIESDRFDAFSAHLCLFDREKERDDPKNAVVGVYRLMDEQAARNAGGFYSETEFNLEAIRALKENKLELGRTCVHQEYRDGLGMTLLWKKLVHFIEENNIGYLFGTASIQGTNIDDFKPVLSFLQREYLASKNKRAVSLQGTLECYDHPDKPQGEIMSKIPLLIRAYLRLGGRVGEGHFVDHDFNTIDVFMIVDNNNR